MENEANLIKRAMEECSLDATKCKNWPPLEVKLDILSAEWEGGIPMRREDSPVEKPHWEDSFFNSFEEEDDEDILHFLTGSERPAAYTFKDRPKLNVRIRFEFKAGTPPNSFTLSGTLGTLKMQSQTHKAGSRIIESNVALEITNPPAVLLHVEARARLKIKWDNGLEMDFAKKPRLEVFFLYDNPTKFPFFKDGVWVEALRFAFHKAMVAGRDTPVSIAAAITRHCHLWHGVKYDTVAGGSGFNATATVSTAFMLKDYMSKKSGRLIRTESNTVNCYDQAAAVQCLCGGLGVKADWLYLKDFSAVQPMFGFIKLTDLVGVGSCNNPFFNYPDPSISRNPVWKPDDPKTRTSFDNHAFLQVSDDPSDPRRFCIMDACAGPHSGGNNLHSYLWQSIDADYEIMYVWGVFAIITPADLYRSREAQTTHQPGVTGIVW
jgi:hypothetical protein